MKRIKGSSAFDMAGMRFGSVTVLRRTGTCSSRDAKWLYRCDCGVEHESSGYSIRKVKGFTCPECTVIRVSQASIKHGKTETPEYKTWTDVKTRCLNPSSTGYKNYGGRGITICNRWKDSFEAFLEDMGEKPTPNHSIDRIDNDGNYEPGNCQWVTIEEQIRNRRITIKVEVNGATKTLAEWCKEYDCTFASAYYRYRQGLGGEAVFKTMATTLTLDGLTDTISGWSKRTGIAANTISMRVNQYGWSVTRALTEGVKKCA